MEGRQEKTRLLTGGYQEVQETAIVAVRVVSVVVGCRLVGGEGIAQGPVQAFAVLDADVCRALVDAVEKVRENLVGDQQPQEVVVAVSRKRPEERCTVDACALLIERPQSIAS